MRLAIIGNSSCDRNATRAVVRELLSRYHPSTVLTGMNAVPGDIVTEEARGRGIDVLHYRPKRLSDSFFSPLAQIANDCDVLVRLTIDPHGFTGSAWSLDIARELGKTTEQVVIPPGIEQ